MGPVKFLAGQVKILTPGIECCIYSPAYTSRMLVSLGNSFGEIHEKRYFNIHFGICLAKPRETGPLL